MKYLLLFAMLIMPGLCRGQDLSGQWTGEMPQVTSALKYSIDMTIFQQGDSLSGSIRYTAAQYWVVQTFKGAVKGKNVSIDEYSVIGCNCVNGVKFCLKNIRGQLVVDSAKSTMTIAGDWTSQSYYDGKNYIKGQCAPGKFTISKQVTVLQHPTGTVVATTIGGQSGISSIATPTLKPPAYNVRRRLDVVVPAPKSTRPRDGYFDKTTVSTSRVTPYAPLREADVTFMKRVWREIDLREKANTYLGAPQARLIDALLDAIKNDKLSVYDTESTTDDPGGDAFSKPLTTAQALVRLADSSVVSTRDANNNIISSKMQANEIIADSIVRFRIKEDWMFDKQRSVMEPRIIGIAPLIKLKGAGNLVSDYTPAFWIYFPDARKILAAKPIANNNNDATGLSFDDAFMKRLFTSYIVKISNNKDERIKDYEKGIDKLYEAERIKKQLMDWELDLWQY